MASRRNLKKVISDIIGDILSECIIYANYVPGVDEKEVSDLMLELLDIDEEFIARISHTEPGNAKKYYRAFYTDFDNRINAVIDRINNLKK